MAREIKKENIYRERLLKLIPSEIVAAYIFIQGVIPEENAKLGLLLVIAILLILTPLYLRKFEHVTNLVQIAITTLSFLVWVYSLGGPFKPLGIYQPWIGSTILVLWTLIVPLIKDFKPEAV